LPDVERRLLLIRLGGRIFNSNAKHLAEVLAQTVGCGTLDTAASGGNVTLDGGSIVTASKLLLLGLLTLDNGHCEKFLVDLSVVIKNFEYFLAGFTLGKVGGMTL
jgi:hypothetical protein